MRRKRAWIPRQAAPAIHAAANTARLLAGFREQVDAIRAQRIKATWLAAQHRTESTATNA